MKKVVLSFIFTVFLICVSNAVYATEITKESKIFLGDTTISSRVIDNNENTYITIKKEEKITIKSNEKIKGVYIIYESSSKNGAISGNGKEALIGENNFLHEYIDIEKKIGNVEEVNLRYDEDVKIGEIYVIGDGELPDFVEIWESPCEKADLLLFTTHSDDEQLFFLGLLPTYVDKGAYVQVVYLCNHNDNPSRLHEQLHGLYTIGIKNYPIMGIVPDAYSTTLQGAITNLKNAKLTEDDVQKFQVEMIRRFKPQVVVGHDEKGEYSHGQHILNTYLLEKAIISANDENYDKETYNKYGKWQISKLYLHLYEKNQITMNYDIPLDYFNGKTAYEVSKEGYKKHLSQQWTWFTDWINGKNNSFTKATQIKNYSPLVYGLYFTNVGEDIKKDDIFENIVYYKEQERIQKEIEETIRNEQEKNAQNMQEDSKQENIAECNYGIYFIIGIISLVVITILSMFLIKKIKSRVTK